MRLPTIILIAVASLLPATFYTLASDEPEQAVVINEVCWAGAAWDHTAEWIELFNMTDQPIDLDGWKLVSSDGAPLIRLQGVIQPRTDGEPASGFFLLERGSDESVPEIAADMVYQGALNNWGETLALVDATGRIIDTANAPSDQSNIDWPAWPAGSDHLGIPPFASMERVRFMLPDVPSNWAGFRDEVCQDCKRPIRGTPRAENSVFNDPPIARITITPSSPQPGIPAQFSAEDSYDPNDAILRWHWDFGDGNQATGPVVEHTYAEPGEYVVTLTLEDSKDGQTILATRIRVAFNDPPLADFSLLLEKDCQLPRAGALLTFQDESSDHDSPITCWHWDFGDGNQAVGHRVTHSYQYYGDYIVELRVTDAAGTVGIQTRSLSIASRLPIVYFTWSPQQPNQSETVHFDASQSHDPDGQIMSYHWDFDGDGVIDQETQQPMVTHEFASSGQFTIRLYVADDTLQRAMRQQTIDVNAAPIAQFQISSFEPCELEPVTMANLSHDHDGTIVHWHWDFGDGATSDQESPTHPYQQNGPVEIVLTVTDDLGATATAIAAINVRNLPPVAALNVAEATLPTGSMFSFDASDSLDLSPQGRLTKYEWSLDGGSEFLIETSAPSLSRAFADDGQVTVVVRVTDCDGAVAVSAPAIITVTNRQPAVSRVTWAPTEPTDSDIVVFTAQAADPDGEITGWIWTLESGVAGHSREFIHTFPDDGTYVLSLQVRDDDGAVSDIHYVTIAILNARPVAMFTATQTSACGVGSIQFDASGSYDPSPTGRIVHIAWDFGDGTSFPGSGSGCSDADRLTPQHCYSDPGTFIVTLVVIDEQGAMSVTRMTINISE